MSLFSKLFCKKVKYPKITVLRNKEDGKWDFIVAVRVSDVKEFNKKVYDLVIKTNTIPLYSDSVSQGDVFMDTKDLLHIIDELGLSSKYANYISYIRDVTNNITVLFKVFIFDICKFVKQMGYDCKKEFDVNNYKNCETGKAVLDYVDYLCSMTVIQNEPLTEMYDIAYLYIIEHHKEWLCPTVMRKDYNL